MRLISVASLLAGLAISLDRRYLDFDRDARARTHAARVENGIPVHAPIRSVDDARAFETDTAVAVGIERATRVTKIQGEGIRQALDGQVARDAIQAGGIAHDEKTREANGRKGRRIQEIVASELCVAIGITRVDTRGVDRDFQARVCRFVGVDVATP